MRPERLAQRADQIRVLGEALHQNGARAFQRRLDGRDILVCVDEGRRLRFWILLRRGEQRVGERRQAAFDGDLRLGAPLGFERKINVLQARLVVGVQNQRAKLVVEFALRLDRFENDLAALLQLAQIAQSLVEAA